MSKAPIVTVGHILVIAILTGIQATGPMRARAQSEAPREAAADAAQAGALPENPRPDELGGVASRHILVQLKSEAHQRIRMAHRVGLANSDPRNQLSERFQTTSGAWQAVQMRPLFAGPFADPALAARHGLDRMYIIDVPRGTDTPVMAEAFGAIDEEVESAGYDSVGGIAEGGVADAGVADGDMAEGRAAAAQFIPDDPEFPLQWGMHNTGQTIQGQVGTPDADIDAPEAWAIHTGNFGTVTVAEISNGLSSHPEYGNNAAPFPNGRVLHGYNTVLDSDDPADLVDASVPFGTRMAGTMAATGNNGLGIAGVTWGAYLFPVNVLTGNTGNVTDLAEGIVWAADHGADVINMGLQYIITSPATIALLQSAVDYAHDQGALLIAAVGQAGFLPCGLGAVCYPAKANHVVGVSATRNNDQFDSQSTYGPQVDICAPGRDIRTTTVSAGYVFQSGTGIASAHVSGVAALIKSYAPYRTNDQITQIIQNSADDLGASGWDDHFGHGRVNAASALVAALECADPFLPDGTPCTDDGNDCTGDGVCMGGFCTHPNLGAGTACGNQLLQGPCDQADVCDGNGLCVLYVSDGTQCRGSTGACDPAEFCTGSSPNCPPDAFLPDQAACTSDGNDCTGDVCIGGGCTHPNLAAGTVCGNQTPQVSCDQADVCDGNGMCVPNLVSGGMECRASADECDPTEFCTGSSAECPPDQFLPDQTACMDDGNDCTDDVCIGGACTHPNLGTGTVCGNQTPQGPCDQADICDGDGQCVPNYATSGTPCRAAASECDVPEFCTGSGVDCPVDAFAQSGAPCPSDGDECTDDVCNGAGICLHPSNQLCGACCLFTKSCIVNVLAATCTLQGGGFLGALSVCLGDSDNDGIDDQCDNCAGVDDNIFGVRTCSASGLPCQSSAECPQGEACQKACIDKIPTVSHWGVLVLALSLLAAGKVYFGALSKNEIADGSG